MKTEPKRPAPPVTLNVPIGQACQNRCSFCVQYSLGTPFSRTLPDIEAQLEQLKSKTREVIFTSGEPTLSKLLEPAIRAARERGYTVISLVTNGRRLRSLDLCTRLLDAGLTEITVSVHGHEASIHDEITCKAGAFEQTEEGLRHLAALRQERDFSFKLTCTLVKQNMAYMREMNAFAESLCVDSLNFNAVEARGSAAENFKQVVPRYSDVMDAADAAILDIDLSLSRVPSCAGGSDWVQEDFHFAISNHISHYDPEEGKVKGPPCETCAISSACPGIWEAYAKGHGWSDLVPLVHPGAREKQDHGVDIREPEFMRSIRRGFIEGYRSLELTGDDPLRDTRLPRILHLARSFGYLSVLVETDARCLAPPGVAVRLHELGLREVVVKIRGGTEKSHDERTGIPGSFQETVTGMGRMTRAGHPFTIRLRLPRRDEEEIARARSLARTVLARDLEVIITELE